MADTNPFEDVDRAIGALIEKQLELVRELDRMDVDVTSWEADFIQSVLTQLEAKTPLTPKQLAVVHRMVETYEIETDYDF
jgi:hypothetical protein